MKKFFRIFIKERIKYIGITAALIFLFAVTTMLMGMPARALEYPLGLCAFVGMLIFAADYLHMWGKYKGRGDLESISFSVIDSMPEAQSEEAKEYQRAIRLLGKEHRDFAYESRLKYENMMDYYTVWAHQIKTPISSMKLSLRGEDSDLARKLSAELFRIEQYVNMALAYLRLDSQSTDYVFRECDMDELIKKSAKKFAAEFISRKLTLSYEPAEITVVSDSKWLGFVLEQLISNALKYTREGGIKIYFEQDRTLVIEDSGIGIAPEDLPRIFEKGYTGYNGRRDTNASGIGLYLCKRICDNLEVGISAESEVAKGTRMCLDFSQYGLSPE